MQKVTFLPMIHYSFLPSTFSWICPNLEWVIVPTRVYWSRWGYGVYFISLHIKLSSNTCDDYLHSTNTNTIDTIIATCSFATLKFHHFCCNPPHVEMGVKLLWRVEFDPFMCIFEQLLVKNGIDWYCHGLGYFGILLAMSWPRIFWY
jgi:hypothetical protein